MENSLHFQFGLDSALSEGEEISKAQMSLHIPRFYSGEGGLALMLLHSE